jgi:hypothetical protein
MNCKLYSALSTAEQFEFIGKLVIAAQSDDFLFRDARRIVVNADNAGIYQHTKPHADAQALSDIENKIENFS